MNKRNYFVLAILLLFTAGLTPLSAAEADVQHSDFVKSLLNNQYMQENIKLIGLAEKSHSEGLYDDAIKYAQEAIRYSELSDDFISRQTKIKDVNDAIDAAQSRLDWAKGIGAPSKHAEMYGKAETSFNDSVDARSREEWDGALDSAKQVIAILANLPQEQPSSSPVLPAQYVVKTWESTKDCLWNIAGKAQIYGDPWQWRLIYNANKSKLPQPGNPDLIEPGLVLDIPNRKGETRSGVLD
jgi:hypothetical protein